MNTDQKNYDDFVHAASIGDIKVMKSLLDNSNLKNYSKINSKNIDCFGTKSLLVALLNEQNEAVDFLINNVPGIKYILRKDEYKISFNILKQLITENKINAIDKMASILSSGRTEKEFIERNFCRNFGYLLDFSYKCKNEKALEHLLSDNKWSKFIDFKAVNVTYLIYQMMRKKDLPYIQQFLSGKNIDYKHSIDILEIISDGFMRKLPEVIFYIINETTHLKGISYDSITQALEKDESDYVIDALEKKKLKANLEKSLSKSHNVTKRKL